MTNRDLAPDASVPRIAGQSSTPARRLAILFRENRQREIRRIVNFTVRGNF